MGDNDIIGDLSKLRKENEKLLNELQILKKKPRNNIGYVILFGGALLVLNAIYYSSEISAYVGIALLFWGAIILYVSPDEYVRKRILDVSVIESIFFIDKILKELKYSGDPLYISPKSLWGLRNSTIIVPKNELHQIPSDDLMSNEDISILEDGVIKVNPPGLGLSKYIEDEMKIDFSSTDLMNLQSNLGNMLVNDLGLVKTFQISISERLISIEMTESLFFEILSDLIKFDNLKHIGGPLVSALACIVARSTRKPVFIQDISVNHNEKSIKTVLHIMDI